MEKGRILFNGNGLLLIDYFNDQNGQVTQTITYMCLWTDLCMYVRMYVKESCWLCLVPGTEPKFCSLTA